MALNSIVGAYGIGTYETSEFKYETVNVRQKMLNGVSVLTFTTKTCTEDVRLSVDRLSAMPIISGDFQTPEMQNLRKIKN